MQPLKEQVYSKRLRVTLNGYSVIGEGLTQIKGIGRRFAQAIIKVINLDSSKRIGDLTDEELKRIEDIILDPLGDIPNKYLFNRMRDLRTGSNKHFTGKLRDITVKRDIDRKKRLKNIKWINRVRRGYGLRHKNISEQFNKLIKDEKQIALDKLRCLMINEGSEDLRINKIYLMEIFPKNLLLPNMIEIKLEMVLFLKDKGINVKDRGGHFQFSSKIIENE